MVRQILGLRLVEATGRKPEAGAGSPESEAGSRKPEARTASGKPEDGSRKPEPEAGR